MTKQDLYQMYKGETGSNPDTSMYFYEQCSECDETVSIDVNLKEFEYVTWLEEKLESLLNQNNLKSKSIL